jgi:hypothetical protein
MVDKISRRDAVHSGAVLGACACLVAACTNRAMAALTCTDTSDLQTAQVKMRMRLEYDDVSPAAGLSCVKCANFIAPSAAGTCGMCKVLSGPINPGGHCRLFVLA